DFGGFPAELYQIEYPAPGGGATVGVVGDRLTRAGIPFHNDPVRGLNHGAWVVLRLLFPAAGVPVVAMSVNPALSPQAQYQVGRALADLRRDDVLIIGSGGTVHNFATMNWRDEPTAEPWAVAFDDWVLSKVTAWDLESLFAYGSFAPNAQIAVPPHGNEHFVPLFYAMGAADDQRTARELHRSYRYGSLSHALWQFGG
ncbi:MAG: DODA-type extradiol aromatic ring-opening family dioxygenase, partial [Mycobacterium leprae]